MGTTTINISSGEPAPGHPVDAAQARNLLLRQLLLCVACVVLALVPFFVPQHVIESVPRFGVVLYYAVLSLLAGWFGIKWLWQIARVVLSADHERTRRDA